MMKSLLTFGILLVAAVADRHIRLSDQQIPFSSKIQEATSSEQEALRSEQESAASVVRKQIEQMTNSHQSLFAMLKDMKPLEMSLETAAPKSYAIQSYWSTSTTCAGANDVTDAIGIGVCYKAAGSGTTLSYVQLSVSGTTLSINSYTTADCSGTATKTLPVTISSTCAKDASSTTGSYTVTTASSVSLSGTVMRYICMYAYI